MSKKDRLEIDFFPEDPNNDCDCTCDCCCDASEDVTFNACENFKEITIDDVLLKCQGRLLKVDVELDRVCPGRDINVGVLVCEEVTGTDQSGKDVVDESIIRGFRACTLNVPGESEECIDNVNVGPFCFVIPEDNLCDERDLKVHVIAHYSNLGSCPC